MIFTLGPRGLSRTLGPAEHTFKHNAGSNSEVVVVVVLLVVVVELSQRYCPEH